MMEGKYVQVEPEFVSGYYAGKFIVTDSTATNYLDFYPFPSPLNEDDMENITALIAKVIDLYIEEVIKNDNKV